MAKTVLENIASADNVRLRLSAATGKLASRDDVDAVQRLAERPQDWRMVPHANESLKTILDLTPDLVPYIAGRKWVLARFKQPLLLTADTPVALWARAPSAYGIGIGTADELRFPLDTQHALILRLDGAEAVWDLHGCHAADLNRTVAAYAYEWVYHHPDLRPLEDFKMPRPREAITVG